MKEREKENEKREKRGRKTSFKAFISWSGRGIEEERGQMEAMRGDTDECLVRDVDTACQVQLT